MSLKYKVGDLVYVPQAVELLDCADDDAQLRIPLRICKTEEPILGVVSDVSLSDGYVTILCNGDNWTVRKKNIYSIGENS